MGISELVLIGLVGLALFGGAININFKGVISRRERRELDNKRTPAQKRLRSIIKKPQK